MTGDEQRDADAEVKRRLNDPDAHIVRLGSTDSDWKVLPLESYQGHWALELRRHVHDVFTRGDELLRQQCADPSRTLDRPTTRFEPSREHQQPVALLAISPDPNLVDEPPRRIKHRGHVPPLVGIDPDDEHLAPRCEPE